MSWRASRTGQADRSRAKLMRHKMKLEDEDVDFSSKGSLGRALQGGFDVLDKGEARVSRKKKHIRGLGGAYLRPSTSDNTRRPPSSQLNEEVTRLSQALTAHKSTKKSNRGPNYNYKFLKSKNGGSLAGSYGSSGRPSHASHRPSSSSSSLSSTMPAPSTSKLSRSSSYGEFGSQSAYVQVAVRVSSSPITVPNDNASRKERYIPLNTSSNPSYTWKTALLSCGSNHGSQLGHNLAKAGKVTPFESSFKDVKTDGLTIRSVAIGGAYGFATTSNYALYGWGTGPIPPTTSSSTPSHFSQTYASLTKVNLPQPVAKVSCGTMHAACITINGALYTWGSGDSGRLGHGDTTPRAYPTAVKLDGTGILYTFGSNKGGQLGTGDIVNRLSPAVVTCSAWRRGAAVARVTCGMHHTIAIAVTLTNPPKRRVYAWGWGEHGRLGVGHVEILVTPTEVALLSHRNIVDVKAGEQHSLAMGEEGDVYSWGSNRFGQLGVSLPSTSLHLNLLPQKLPLPTTSPVISISAGSRHSGVVTEDGEVITWGWGEEGQLGNGREQDEHSPYVVAVPKIKGAKGRVKQLSLGISHSLILVENTKIGVLPSSLTQAEEKKESLTEENVAGAEEEEEEEVVAIVDIHAEMKRRKQLEFAAKLEASAAQAAIEADAAAETQERELRAVEERREKDKETLKRFEKRREEIREKEGRKERERQAAARSSMLTVSLAQPSSYDQVYYHPEQSVDKCFVANAARRAMMRKIKAGAKGGKGGNGGKNRPGKGAAVAKGVLRRSSFGGPPQAQKMPSPV
ncbi:hypothetical protein TrRE_jg909 [Triparma retinervis]|uniref:RCC1-like domain-containing protein n=1 Tax=Triparma retinervis TaxID=2557542 RepID=A0A9W7ASI7_9STRA|nr:hypothetical protein TrRE_jg909 [Triparma retinervis]